MAVHRLKPRRRRETILDSPSPPSTQQSSTIICEPWMVKKWKRPRETKKLNLYLPGPPPVLVMPGRRHLSQQVLPRSLSMSRTELEHKDDEATIPFSDSLHFSDHPVPRRLTSSQKRANQWRRWSEDIIPRMIVPYLSYIEETLSLRHANVPGERHSNDGECGTGCRTRSIKVACVLFDGMLSSFLSFNIGLMYFTAFEEITIIACPCFPAPLQLLRRGLFPCAPMVPSLAVDLRVLEFVRLLFVRQSPNQTAWCDALETFLDGMRYKLTSKVSISLLTGAPVYLTFFQNSLRRRFSNAFHWYRVLTVLARDHISTLITDARKDGSHVDQPSEYLRSRCPLCFGGNDWRNEVRGSPSMCVIYYDSTAPVDHFSRPNIIVCIDACFTQKCSTNPRGATGSDPPNPTSSFFLPTADVNAMEDFVQRCRGEGRQARASRAEPDEDCYEEGMRVPVSVLNGCGDSFIAADEKREKASTRFFTDTGLMALLCRHDRVLWVANLTSAGEKQHYALALLDRLFKHLPAQMTIGLLYDIGCQLERSCRKWKFMDDNTLSRIAFAVAVFHAYGHQWPCQIVYHPRKREGFGLSDGEGCERLWSFLKPLIPSLRVSGVRMLYSYHSMYLTLRYEVQSAAFRPRHTNSSSGLEIIARLWTLAPSALDPLSNEEKRCTGQFT